MTIPDGREEDYLRLVERFRVAGADDPESWARSEIGEDFAQLARFCFLRSLWPHVIDRWRQETDWIDRAISMAERDPKSGFADAGMAIKDALARGVTRDELASIARMIAYATTFDVVNHIDDGEDVEYNPDNGYPFWTLSEIGPDEQPTGRSLDALHEDLLSMDPSGREGPSRVIINGSPPRVCHPR
jgi:hypothetical protein